MIFFHANWLIRDGRAQPCLMRNFCFTLTLLFHCITLALYFYKVSQCSSVWNSHIIMMGRHRELQYSIHSSFYLAFLLLLMDLPHHFFHYHTEKTGRLPISNLLIWSISLSFEGTARISMNDYEEYKEKLVIKGVIIDKIIAEEIGWGVYALIFIIKIYC